MASAPPSPPTEHPPTSSPPSSSTTSRCTRCVRARRRSARPELRSLTGERLELAVAKRDAYEAIVVGVLGGRRAEPAWWQPLDPKLTAFAVISMCTNVGIWYRPDGRLTLSEVARCLRDHGRAARRSRRRPTLRSSAALLRRPSRRTRI